MQTATRFTTNYETSEDRVKLSLELSEDEVQILWLTRRLLNRLVPPLVEHLHKTSGAGVSVDTAPQGVRNTTTPARAAVQKFSQEAAVSAIERQPAVGSQGQRPSNNLSYLVTSVDIGLRAKGVTMGFKSGEDLLHSLPFSEDALRQWLSIVCAQYKAGDWREGFWPTWIQPVNAPAPKTNDLLPN
jgi:hypothetical protein